MNKPKEISLAERIDGKIVSYASPVPCDCCGKLCTARYFVMQNGDRLGKDCAELFYAVALQTQYAPAAREEWAKALGANKKQTAYAVSAPTDFPKPFAVAAR